MEILAPHRKLWGLGLALLLIGRFAGLVLPGAPKFLIDEAIPQKDFGLMATIVAVVLGATVIHGLCSFALTQTISKAGQRTITSLRVKLHSHVSRLPIRYFDDHKTGEVTSRVMDDVENVRNLVGTGMIEFIGGLLTAALAFAILLFLNWQMTLTILLFLLIVMFVMIKAFMVLRPIYRERQEIKGEVSGRLVESIGGVRVVKSYSTEETERVVFKSGAEKLLKNVLKTINGVSVLALTSSVLVGLLGSTIMFLGGAQLISGAMSTGDFISYVLYLGLMVAPLSSIVMIGTQLSEVFAGIERMNEILGEKTEDADEETKDPVPPITGNVEFENVSFSYIEGKPVLHNISLSAEPGSVTALVGPSGSGKSTLTGLIAGFYMPESGRVLVDGMDLTTVKIHDYRRQLGAVLQDNFLFDGTIRENILYPRPDASESELKEAAQRAHCLEFIDRFEEGFDTIIGERGVKLSGGQRQRVAIARALLANPRLLILDEATSSLDSESEAYIQEGLSLLMKGRTSFVIAHRLSTIRNADAILVLEEGSIVERGTHAELLERGGRYFDMYTKQHGLEANLFLAPGEKPRHESEDGEENEDDESTRRRKANFARLLSGE